MFKASHTGLRPGYDVAATKTIWNRTQIVGGKNWKRVSGILCDRRISLRVKGKVYKTVVRPAMLYGAATWTVKKAQYKRVVAMEVPGKRRRGRIKRRWLDSIRNDLSERELSMEDAQDRAKLRRLIRHIDPT